MKRQPNVTESMGGDVFMPMVSITCADDYDEGAVDESEEESEGC